MTHPFRTLVATFLVAAAVLATEIILTRVFSVVMWYHFAFLAISVCLFGLGLGALALHLFGSRIRAGEMPRHLGRAAVVMALSQIAVVALLRTMKLGDMDLSVAFLAKMSVVFLAASAPFAGAGFFLGLVFSRGADRIGAIYLSDLAGAAAGCVATIFLLDVLGGEAALLGTALVAIAGGLVACAGIAPREETYSLAGAALVLASIIGVHSATGFLTIHHSKGNDEPDPIVVRWNTFSRVIAYHRPQIGDIMLEIDGVAHTPVTPYTGDAQATQTPDANLQRLPYEFLENEDVLVVGSGGGEHILTALAAGARHVLGVEMNPIIIGMVEQEFASMAGGLFQAPNVDVVLAEGRSYIARAPKKFDVINFTLVDTWAATAGGAFALTENYLFTKEAFHEYFDHLTPRGMLAVKRWRDAPEYVLRMAALGRAVLEERGVDSPENCVFVATNDKFANVMIRNTPFTLDDIHELHADALALGLEILYSPYTETGLAAIKQMLRAPVLADWLRAQHLDLAPPTDNRPFFFNTLRLSDLAESFKLAWSAKIRNVGLLIVFALFGIASAFVALLMLGPLVVIRRHRLLLSGHLRAALFFAAIGVGYLVLEIAVMQSFILYLGHPTLTLAVFLATLLASSAAGSGASSFLGKRKPRLSLVVVVVLLIGAALLLRAGSPRVFAATLGLPVAQRAFITVLLLFPLGFLMGMPFPLGVRAVNEDETVPWMFAVNSAASVLGSVAAIVLAMSFGFTAATLAGLAAYGLAAAVYPADEG
ncbi:hypothetical protein K8I61_02240 [bacterium]|nr:hypothetical protein [bacterium]